MRNLENSNICTNFVENLNAYTNPQSQSMFDTYNCTKHYISRNRFEFRRDKLFLYLLYKIYQSGDSTNSQVLKAVKASLYDGADNEIPYPDIDQASMQIFLNDLAETVRHCISELSETPTGGFNHILKTPDAVAKLCVERVQPQLGEKVYLPFSGLATEAIMLPSNVEIMGEELDELTWALGQIRLWSVGKSSNGIKCGDSFSNLDPHNLFGIEDQDVIIMQPPYGLNIKNSDSREDLPWIVENCFQHLSERGRMAVVMPSTFLVASRFREFRRNVLPYISSIEHTNYEAGYRHEEYVLVTLCKQKSNYIALCYGSKSEIWDKTKIDQANLLPKYYLEKVEIKSDYNLFPIRKLIEPAPLRMIKENEYPEIVTRANLSDDISDYSLREAKRRPSLESLVFRLGRCVLRERAILISNALPIMVAEFVPTAEKPAIAIDTRSVFAFKLSKGENDGPAVLTSYLIFALLGQDLSSQLEHKFSSNSFDIVRFTRDDLKEILIPVPPKNEQEKIVNKAVMESLSESQRLAVRKLEETIQHQRILRHQLGSMYSLLRTKIENLDAFRKENGGLLHDNDFLSRRMKVTVADQFEAIMEVADEVGELIASMRDHSQDYPLGTFNLNNFFEDLVKRYDDVDKYGKINFVPNIDSTDVLVRFREQALKVVCGNIIDNAIRHGFGNKINPLHDMIRIRWRMEGNAAVVEISNNGKPLTMNPDLVLKIGETSDQRNGEGIGGYQIYNHMKADGDEVEVISTPEEEYTVTYRLKFNNIIYQTKDNG